MQFFKSLFGYGAAPAEDIKSQKQKRMAAIEKEIWDTYEFDIQRYKQEQQTAAFLKKELNSMKSNGNAYRVAIGTDALFQEYEQLRKNIGAIKTAEALPFTSARELSPSSRSPTGAAGVGFPAPARSPTAPAAAAANSSRFISIGAMQVVPARRSPVAAAPTHQFTLGQSTATSTVRPKVNVGGRRKRTGGKHSKKQTKRRASSKTRRSTRKH